VTRPGQWLGRLGLAPPAPTESAGVRAKRVGRDRALQLSSAAAVAAAVVVAVLVNRWRSTCSPAPPTR
jgi:hypothetical protein